jgi:hypothetical protein
VKLDFGVYAKAESVADILRNCHLPALANFHTCQYESGFLLGQEPAALDALRVELQRRGVKVEDGSRGYRVLIIQDLDGNRLFFNYPNEDLT